MKNKYTDEFRNEVAEFYLRHGAKETSKEYKNVAKSILEDEEFFKETIGRNHLSHRVAYIAIKTLVHSQKQPMTAVQMDKKLTYDEMKEVSDKYRELAEKVANDE